MHEKKNAFEIGPPKVNFLWTKISFVSKQIGAMDEKDETKHYG